MDIIDRLQDMMRIIGRSSSHFTRVARMFAHELDVATELVVVKDMTSIEATTYAGNPARKMPALQRDGAMVFGSENICRVLSEASVASRTVVWPEALRADVSRNAQEMVSHAMAAQVQVVFGTQVCKLPPENVYFMKGRAGLEGALAWLDGNLDDALAQLPEKRDVSYFEVTLFCLLEHLVFRATVELQGWPRLVAFAAMYRERASAKATAYKFDA